MDKTLLINKSIALIVFNTEKDDDVRVFLGRCQADQHQCYFVNEEKGWKLALDEEQLERIQPVSDETKEILLFADYALQLTMDNLPDDESGELVKTGLKWKRHLESLLNPARRRVRVKRQVLNCLPHTIYRRGRCVSSASYQSLGSKTSADGVSLTCFPQRL